MAQTAGPGRERTDGYGRVVRQSGHSSRHGSKVAPVGVHVPSHDHGYLRPVRPGEVRNPTGKGGLWREAQRITREKSPDAARRLVELMYGDDDRVAPTVAEMVMVRSWGKPPDYDLREDRPALKINTSTMSPGECALLLGLLRRGLPVPDEPELDEVPQINTTAGRYLAIRKKERSAAPSRALNPPVRLKNAG